MMHLFTCMYIRYTMDFFIIKYAPLALMQQVICKVTRRRSYRINVVQSKVQYLPSKWSGSIKSQNMEILSKWYSCTVLE